MLNKSKGKKGNRGKKLYLCGQYKSGLSTNSLVWEFQGIFSSHKKAVKARKNINYFIFPVALNKEYPIETVKVTEYEYPLNDNKPSNDYELEWQSTKSTKHEETITISKSYFEHLLNCLANQRFIGELPPNGDAMALEQSEYAKIQTENQNVINKAWSEGMFLLYLERKMRDTYKEMVEKYCEVWNKNLTFINDCMADDTKKYPNDANIPFKWNQLVVQEIEMWMRLCCFSNVSIDCKNEKYTHGVVAIEDFDNICERRGFTPTMRNFLIDILGDIGIGEQLCKDSNNREGKYYIKGENGHI